MTRIIFIEGVSGVGKSTMTANISALLRAQGFHVQEYLEFDASNPIDFYSTAYIEKEEFEKLCAKHEDSAVNLRSNAVDAGSAMLVRYCNGSTPLFQGELQRELEQCEFCYKPQKPVPIEAYTEVYRNVWRRFAANIGSEYDYIIFDGSCLHHPINDLMRNYGVDGETALNHVSTLLNALGSLQRKIFYMYTSDIPERLAKARAARGQTVPTDAQTDFWKRRNHNDVYVIERLGEECCMVDISNGWDEAEKLIMEKLH